VKRYFRQLARYRCPDGLNSDLLRRASKVVEAGLPVTPDAEG
jgi:hypothetical protein